jgi:aminoglycoside phosphotransferase (APT) family kinase protein
MATDFSDQSSAVRPGEALDADRLAAYLQVHLPDGTGQLRVEQFPSGYSNLTYRLRLGDRDLVLRRPPFGANIKSAHDMRREYQILSHLIQVYPRVPRPLLYCDDLAVLGAPFYVMERVCGVILRARPPAGLRLSPETMERVATAFIDNLAALHAVDYSASGLDGLGRPRGYGERQIAGWTQRYQNAQTDDVPEMQAAAAWLATHLPGAPGAALIHNDYKYDNLVLAPDDLGRIVAVLDWEMATIGDPLMDLGTTLGYWIDPRDPPEMRAMFGLTTLPGNLNRAQLLERYVEKSGRSVADPVFYYTYGLFKIGVIVQQIYARYQQGHTQDARFAGLNHVVRALGRTAAGAIERGRID